LGTVLTANASINKNHPTVLQNFNRHFFPLKIVHKEYNGSPDTQKMECLKAVVRIWIHMNPH
jgi:hypothetical protein